MNLKCMIKHFIICSLLLVSSVIWAQKSGIEGTVRSLNGPFHGASIAVLNSKSGASTDKEGHYSLVLKPGTYNLEISYIGYISVRRTVLVELGEFTNLDLFLEEQFSGLDEVVISGTMKEVSKLESPVPVEVYSSQFFKANPTPSIFESLQNVNGVRPQLNCNVCNTGDIHINGLEGPYTMILIDGMPIVSGLSTVYGLTGIPQSLIERVEIVKGPASTLYGSEAVGGLVNIITKKPNKAPIIAADVFSSNWGDVNTDLGFKFKASDKAQSLLGINYFNYQNAIDNNNDGFTDVTLQNRVSVFNKWVITQKDNRIFSLAGRYVYEDRWGGDMNWNPSYRGGDEVYGESIYTSRWEIFGLYQLPVKEDVRLQFSANGHNQNSVYGDLLYIAEQYIGFGQLTWNKPLGDRNDLLAGAAFRYTYYDDNTPATENVSNEGVVSSAPSKIALPGLFIQNELKINGQNKVLAGLRYDYNSLHGSVLTPRLNYKWNSNNRLNTLRVGFGNGYRVANVFTEDHAALTGARTVEFAGELSPETSWNTNINFVKKVFIKKGGYIGIDASAFYTYFTNRIIPDYEMDVNKIIYDNLDGHAVSQGVSVNIDAAFKSGLKILIGGTLMDVSFTEDGVKQRQLLTEQYSGVWSVSYTLKKVGVRIDYTGNVYGPMLLPLLGELDNRPGESPVWSIQNIQFTKRFKKGVEVYGGVKNILNFTPPANSIARSFDPFDRNVQFDANGQVIPTAENPNALSFDPTYVFAPNQGARMFLGVRYILN